MFLNCVLHFSGQKHKSFAVKNAQTYLSLCKLISPFTEQLWFLVIFYADYFLAFLQRCNVSVPQSKVRQNRAGLRPNSASSEDFSDPEQGVCPSSNEGKARMIKLMISQLCDREVSQFIKLPVILTLLHTYMAITNLKTLHRVKIWKTFLFW